MRGDVCGLVAVMAISNCTEPEARAAIQSAANERGQCVQADFQSSRFRDQARAIELLGGKLFLANGQPVRASDLEANRRWAASFLREQPTVAQWLESYSLADYPDRVLVHATRPKPGGVDLESHTFTLDRGWFFDNNTPTGRPVKVSEAPKGSFDMRVVDVVRVQRPPGRRKKSY